ncbi:MAG TPA: PAS domain S-box protein [Afifellaceae bacterium]|nr:PAS domain S-box protein [Afifellaceae bacterium]
MISDMHLIEALSVAVYTTDGEGRLTYYNDAAADLWGHRPELGTTRWCGSLRLYHPDGLPLAHDQSPLARSLAERQPVHGVEIMVERPDGRCISLLAVPSLLRDAAGQVTGGVNVLVEAQRHKQAEIESARLAAIVASSDDAIVSKTLDGIITSWNDAATRILGYEANEMIGTPITRIIPPELLSEEEEIIRRLRRGERVEHFDTVRLRKDGRRVHLSLTISPVHDRSGKVIGASKVARDITERKRAEELQGLLIGELNHRVKNTLAIVQSMASQSLRRAMAPGEFVSAFRGRLQALARAHELLVQAGMEGADLSEIVRNHVIMGPADSTRTTLSGPGLVLGPELTTHMALVLHELATNARKYGALSVPTGRLSISWTVQSRGGQELILQWLESGVPKVSAPSSVGFGTMMIERSLEAHGGRSAIRFGGDGVECEIRLPLQRGSVALDHTETGSAASDSRASPADAGTGTGRRILVVEDEALIAMEIEAELRAAGYEVVGPASTVQGGMRLLSQPGIGAALLDANLGGQPVSDVAAMLTQRGIPFAFVTGYGRENLPDGFGGRPVLTKPFATEQLLWLTESLFSQPPARHKVVPLRQKKSG